MTSNDISVGNSRQPSKFELLSRITHLQNDFASSFQNAENLKQSGNLVAAQKAYAALIATEKDMLETALLHNHLYADTPLDIIPLVQPLLNSMLVRADIMQAIGELRESNNLRDEATKLSQVYTSQYGSAETERSIASSLVLQGRFNEALLALQKSRNDFEVNNDFVKMARTTIDIANILQWLGDYERAIEQLNHAQELITMILQGKTLTEQDVVNSISESVNSIMAGKGGRRIGEDVTELWTICYEIDFFRAIINEYKGQFDEAETLLNKVLPHYERLGVGPAILAHHAAILIKRGQYLEGLQYTYSIEPVFRAGGFLRAKLAALLRNQSEALLHLGKPQESLKKLEEGIKDLTLYYDPDLLWKLQHLEGQCLQFLEQLESALKAYLHATKTVNNLRRAPLGYRLDSLYLRDKLELFQRAIELACRDEFASECCELMELIKSRTLSCTLSIPRVSSALDNDNLGKEFDKITAELDTLEYIGYNQGWTPELKQKRLSILDKRSNLLETIRVSDPRWRTLTEPASFNLANIINYLSSREYAAICLFYLGSDDNVHYPLAAVLIKDGKFSAKVLALSSETLLKLRRYEFNLNSRNPDPKLYDISESMSLTADELVPRELLSEAVDARGLIVIPHKVLHLIPWSGLVFNNKRLFEYCPLSVLPNLSCIASMNAPLSNIPKVALIGSPEYENLPHISRLLGAKSEIKKIESIYTMHNGLIGNPLTGAEVTEENFWKLVLNEGSKDGILHISCHGNSIPDEPMNSGLLLNQSKIDAAEIALSSLKYEEVILSACSTGWRPQRVKGIELVGDDILGLPGAFLEAGVRSVLVSITPAHDLAVFKFMTTYHSNRVNGKSPMGALQETQKDMLRNSRYPPNFWIGFTVYGCQ
jgi:CHAT domain-containing protein